MRRSMVVGIAAGFFVAVSLAWAAAYFWVEGPPEPAKGPAVVVAPSPSLPARDVPEHSGEPSFAPPTTIVGRKSAFTDALVAASDGGSK